MYAVAEFLLFKVYILDIVSIVHFEKLDWK